MNEDLVYFFDMPKIEQLQKVSAQVSLRGLRRLTWIDTLSQMRLAPFSPGSAHLYINLCSMLAVTR